MKWLPLEPTPDELEWMAEMEKLHRQLLTIFMLTPEEIGYAQDYNKPAILQREWYARQKVGVEEKLDNANEC